METNGRSDHELMMRVSNGETSYLGVIYERYKSNLYSYFFRLTNNRDQSEDLVQNVFIRVLKYRSGYSDSGDFKIWLFRIARNLFNDHYKSHKKVEYTDLDEVMRVAGAFMVTDQDKKEEVQFLNKLVNLLDDESRQMVILTKLNGMKYEDVAEVLGTTEGNVKVKVFRAMKKMKEAVLNM